MSLARRVALGAGWMVALRLTDRAVGLLSVAVLARLLAPSDFGIVALAVALIGLLDTVGELSVDLVLIRHQTADRHQYDTAWTLKIIKGMLFATLLVVLAGPIARFLVEPRVEAVIYWLALSVAISGLENIGVVNFRKHLQFHREFLFVMASRTVATMVTVTIAYMWPVYWALVVGMIARRVTSIVLSYQLEPYRPRPSLAAFRELFMFSRWVLLENILNGVRIRTDTFVLGRVAGVQALGHYGMAYEIAMLAFTELEAPIRRAVFPGDAKVASDMAALRKAFLSVFGAVLLISAPTAVGIGLVAKLAVPLFLGERWLPSVPLIELLIFYGFFNGLTGSARLVYFAVGKPHASAALMAVTVVLLVPLVVVGAFWAGPIGVALALVGTAGVMCLATMMVMMRVLGFGIADLATRVWRVGVGVLAMAVTVKGVQGFWGADGSPTDMVVLLAVCAAIGAVSYGLVVMGLWRACGRPDSAEQFALTTTLAIVERLAAGYHRVRHVRGAVPPASG